MRRSRLYWLWWYIESAPEAAKLIEEDLWIDVILKVVLPDLSHFLDKALVRRAAAGLAAAANISAMDPQGVPAAQTCRALQVR